MLFRSAHHEFHHHFGHGRHGHHFGRHADADGFAEHLVARVGAKLDLDDEQQRLLAAWFHQLQQQREGLKGLGPAPALAGRSPSYLARQMWDMQHGFRKGTWTEMMKPVVAKLTDDDLLNIVAYTASLQP